MGRETGSTWDVFGRVAEGPLPRERLAPVVNTNHLWFAWAAFSADAPAYTGNSAASMSGYGS